MWAAYGLGMRVRVVMAGVLAVLLMLMPLALPGCAAACGMRVAVPSCCSMAAQGACCGAKCCASVRGSDMAAVVAAHPDVPAEADAGARLGFVVVSGQVAVVGRGVWTGPALRDRVPLRV